MATARLGRFSALDWYEHPEFWSYRKRFPNSATFSGSSAAFVSVAPATLLSGGAVLAASAAAVSNLLPSSLLTSVRLAASAAASASLAGSLTATPLSSVMPLNLPAQLGR